MTNTHVHYESIKQFARILAIMLALILVASLLYSTVAVGKGYGGEARIVFDASEPDVNGYFSVKLTISNAKFNAFQFVIDYDQNAIEPVDKQGNPTSSFTAFASRGSNNWLATIGTSIDTGKGIIDFSGYVQPGRSVSTGSLPEEKGYANIGEANLQIFVFTFRQIKSGNIKLRLAEEAAVVCAGERLPVAVTFNLPSSPVLPSGNPPIISDSTMTAKERIKDLLILKIGMGAAFEQGKSARVDKDNQMIVPYIENQRTMVPLRFISEYLGAVVEWHSKNQRIIITFGSRTIEMFVGKEEYYLDGKPHKMDTVPVIRTGWARTMVPVRFIAEAFEKHVDWDGDNELVIITALEEPWLPERVAEREVVRQALETIVLDVVVD